MGNVTFSVHPATAVTFRFCAACERGRLNKVCRNVLSIHCTGEWANAAPTTSAKVLKARDAVIHVRIVSEVTLKCFATCILARQ